MATKVRVYGKAQNRTALGIINAYLLIHPQSTLADLRAAFPNSLNPDSGVKENFKDMSVKSDSQWNGFFTKEDELLHLADGTTVAVVSMWTKASLERLVQHAKGLDIEIGSYEEASRGFGMKGGYSLEYLNGFQPVAAAPAKSNTLLYVIIGVVVLAALAAAAWLLMGRNKQETKTVVQRDTITVVQRDTVYVQQVEQIEKNFNAAQFEKNKAELNDQAKFALHDLAKLMGQHPELKVHIVGHTSAEGNAAKNQALSEARAKAAVDFLISQGVDEARLQYEGKGSSEPIDPNNPEANRRTEFIVE